MSTLLDLRTRVSELMSDTGFTTNSSSFVDQSINDAQREIAEQVKLLFKKTTSSSVDGTQSYSLPTDFMCMYTDSKNVVYTDTNDDDTYLNWYTYDLARNSYDDLNDTSVTGTPKFFWLQNKSIYYYKTPDYSGSSNISIEHYYYPATLSGDASIADLPDKYKMAIVYLACAKISDRNELFDQGGMFRLRYYLPELNRIDNTTDESRSSKRSVGSEYLGDGSVGVIG